MSTKIFNAFELKVANPWPLLWKIQSRAEDNVRSALREHYVRMASESYNFVGESELRECFEKARSKGPTHRASSPSELEPMWRLAAVHQFVMNRYKANCFSSLLDTYSLDVNVAVYPHRDNYYIRTFAQRMSLFSGVLDFVSKMRGVSDFHFQNQTERPPRVKEADWKRRRRVWDEITQGDGIGRFVVLEICNWERFFRIDPYSEVVSEWIAKPPALVPLKDPMKAEGEDA